MFILSRFLKAKNGRNIFHFKGCYRGTILEEINIIGGEFIKGEEYLLAIDEIEVKDKILLGRLVKSKVLFT